MYVGLHYLHIIFKTRKQRNNTSTVCPSVYVCWIAFTTIHCPLSHTITANLVALLNVFVFLADLFLFVLHFLCISWALKMVWTIFPCQLVQQGEVLIVCALRIGWHTPSSWALLPVLRLTMMLHQWHLLTFPVICAPWLHHCYWLEFVSFHNEIHFFWWSAVLLDRYFWWALFWFKFEFLVAHFCWQSILQFFKSGLDLKFAWLIFLFAKFSWYVSSCICVSNCNISPVCSRVHIQSIQHLLHWLSILSFHYSFCIYNFVHCVWV